jgi:hypothetical protein
MKLGDIGVDEGIFRGASRKALATLDASAIAEIIELMQRYGVTPSAGFISK